MRSRGAHARIGTDVAGPLAPEIDEQARFPFEAIEALRGERLLSALVPVALGGLGAPLADVAAGVQAISRHCASTGMVVAMHHIQVASIVGHGGTEWSRQFLCHVASEQLLLASATTEASTGGDIRSSACAVSKDGARFQLEKDAPVISYGEHAHAILVTARADVTSAASDQVLVVVPRATLRLDRTSVWNAFGFRGTCSHGYVLRCEGDVEQVLADPFMRIAAHTMLPVSHILWSSVWLGLADAAVGTAHAYVRAEARRKPGTSPAGALRLAELLEQLEQFRGLRDKALAQYEHTMLSPELRDGLTFAIQMNALKTSASKIVVDIAGRALAICGIAGYREDSPYALGRVLRDAHGAALMVNNERLLGANAQMLLAHKGSW